MPWTPNPNPRLGQNVIDDQEEYLEINGKRLEKPLVEKPVSGEDHNIYLYYPRSLGGGSKRRASSTPHTPT